MDKDELIALMAATIYAGMSRPQVEEDQHTQASIAEAEAIWEAVLAQSTKAKTK